MKSITLFFLLATTFLFGQTTMNIYQNNGSVLNIPLSIIDSITYTQNGGTLPYVTTTINVVSITFNSAVSGGYASSNTGDPVIVKGVCYSTTSNPTINDGVVNSGSGNGRYTSTITGLLPSTQYYVRAFATNGTGTAYGSEVSFTTSAGSLQCPSTVSDIDGNVYNVVKIGYQCWIKENLKTSKYRNGDTISYASSMPSNTSSNYSYYNNNSSYNGTYGKLYQWSTANDSRGLCPVGWHVPSNQNWLDLSNELNANGGAMKAITLWDAPNGGATNSSGFTAYGGGMLDGSGYRLINKYGYFWSSTGSQFNTHVIWLTNDLGGFNWGTTSNFFVSVRCIKD